MEGDLVIAFNDHLLKVRVPRLAWIDPQLLVRLPGQYAFAARGSRQAPGVVRARRRVRQVRTRLRAGGSEIRTLGPSLARGLHAVENVDVRSGLGRRLRRRRVRGRRPAGKSRGTDPLARGRCGPTPRAGNRRSRETPDCRAA